MNRTSRLAAALALLSTADAARADDPPRGEVARYTIYTDQFFPGTTRDYSIYVPRQYDPARPACVYVNQDGVQFDAPKVFDALIAAGEMPVTIGVFVAPGRVKAQGPEALDRFNRSYEYDGLGDNYARFIAEVILPDVEKKTAADGRRIVLSKSGNDRAIGGSSSGAIAAFTAAWERPDLFSRVFSSIGTYVGLRGGNEYPTLIRKVEPKPLRIFLEDGSNDLNIYGGDWWMANQSMERSLTFAGYELAHNWGDGGHNGKHATEIFPDAMRFLWKGWPEPVKAGKGSSQLQEIVLPGEGWAAVAGSGRMSTIAADAQGLIYGRDNADGKVSRIEADGTPRPFAETPPGAGLIAFGPRGTLYASLYEKVIALEPGGRPTEVGGEFHGSAFTVPADGTLYLKKVFDGGREDLWSVGGGMENRGIWMNFPRSTAMAFSPDQSLMYLATPSHWVDSVRRLPDGTLAHAQKYYHLHTPDDADTSGARALRVDRDGRLYVATYMGVQVCDQAGRVNAILPLPGPVAGLAFGGEGRNTLFATVGGTLYKRKLKVRGLEPYDPPLKPAPPRL